MLRGVLTLALAALVSTPADVAAQRQRGEAAEALSSPARLVQIGDHGRASGDFMLALSFYERALALDPDYVPALRAATEVALAVRLPQAQALADRWVSKAPRDGLAHLAVGAALVQQNRPTEAMRAFDLAAAASGPPAAIAVQRGLAFDLLGESRSAQVAFADALQRAPGDRSIVEYLALSLAIGGDDAAAMALLQPEAEKASGQASFERTLVLVHALAGRIDLARRIAAANLDAQGAAAVGDLLRRVSELPTSAERAAAVHLGKLPDTGRAVSQAPADTHAPGRVIVEAMPAQPSTPQPSTTQPTSNQPAPAATLPPVADTPAIAVVEPRRAEPAAKPAERTAAASPPAKPAPMPPGMRRLTPAQLKGEHIWLQIASSSNRAMLADDHGKLKAKAKGMLNGYNAYVQDAGTTNRLIVGPFRTMADAVKARSRLKAGGIDGLATRIPAGSNIEPL